MERPAEVTSGLNLAENTIRHLLRSVHMPVSRLVAIAREELVRAPESLAEWDVADLQGDAAKPLIEHRSGPAYTTDELAGRRNVSGETIRKMTGRGELICYPAIRGKGWRFPVWQFVGKNAHVAPWVPELIKAYGHNGWGLIDFITVPRENGVAHLTALHQGEDGVREVLSAAERSNPD